MDPEHIRQFVLRSAIYNLCSIIDAKPEEFVDHLVGFYISEEEAGDIKRYMDET